MYYDLGHFIIIKKKKKVLSTKIIGGGVCYTACCSETAGPICMKFCVHIR